jgi:4-diphosphocytidyl-2-C-methyl-D-erythritol kinase
MLETAYAKINLTLSVRGRGPDGYHDIDTLFAFAEDGDLLSVRDGEGITLEVTGPFASALGPREDNLVLKAAHSLPGPGGARLRLDKRLPVSSGIGGGSADAAAALRLLVRWWQLPLGEPELLGLAASLGADVPACLLSRSVRGTGRGDTLEPGQGPPAATPLLLVNPAVAISTAEVFARWRPGPSAGNDLEPAARELAPEIGTLLSLLGECPGTAQVGMSGSGATCFALFGDEAARDAAAERIRALQPDWWTLVTRLR